MKGFLKEPHGGYGFEVKKGSDDVKKYKTMSQKGYTRYSSNQ